MQQEVSSYLHEVRSRLHLDPRTEQRVISELSTHFEEKVSDLEEEGLPEEAAVRSAIDSFGDARRIARLLYEAHSRGTWTDALIACQPHLIVAGLFATHFWRHPLPLALSFAAIVVIALLAWRNESAPWAYSWMGYAVLPLLVVGYLSLDPVYRTLVYLFSGHGAPAPLWQLGLLGLLDLAAVWLIAVTAAAVARRDWILLSLMLLPLPVLVLWMITVTQAGGPLVDSLRGLEARFSRWDGAMGFFFLVLGVTTALFVRVRQRALKALAVIAVGIIGGAAAARSLWADLGLIQTLAVALGLFLFLTVPFFLRAVLGHAPESKSPLPS